MLSQLPAFGCSKTPVFGQLQSFPVRMGGPVLPPVPPGKAQEVPRSQVEAYETLVRAMPEASRNLLADIFQDRDRASHMKKAQEYGATDPFVQVVNDLIAGLVRLRDEGQTEAGKRLGQLRLALTNVFGKP